MPTAQCEGSGILQIHPTTRCNLACAHCYSHSSPSASSNLPADLICRLIEDAAQLGFGIVSLSGGEPLIYDGLDEVVATAGRCGSRINLVSNGILIRSSRFERHAGKFSVVALSLDGLPDRHNAIRGSAKSFEQVRSAAAVLRAAGQVFGIIHTLCSESLDEVEEIAELAADWGASLLQLHPLEPAGRDLRSVRMTPLSISERLDALLLASILSERFPHVRIQLDLVHRDIARRLPLAIHGAPLRQPMVPRELVLEETGQLVPLTYGLGEAFAVTDIHRVPLAAAWGQYLESRWCELRRHLRRACMAVARGAHGEVVAWHEVVRKYAEGAPKGVLTSLGQGRIPQLVRGYEASQVE
jgi:MoaA/NifB/PqqE/SkfB family radical SAM enzyme